MLQLSRPIARRHRHRVRLAVLTTTTAVVAVGCSSTHHDSSGTGPSQPATKAAQGATNVASAAPASAVDACSLLTAADVTAVIGESSGAKPTVGKNPDTSECTWSRETTNPYSYKAIKLNVSEANTAAGDQLPPPSLGTPPPVSGIGGGARMILVGAIDFPAGDRACEVQVIGLADDVAKQAAITLAGLVRGRS